MVKLEIGKWYTSKQWNTGSYAKFYELNGSNHFVFTESIRINVYSNQKDWWFLPDNITEVSLSEIEKFLPENHFDLQLKNIIYECW